MSAGIYPYDLVPYRSASVPGADCRRIQVIARLFGVPAASCAHARVLELGCGNAANLLPLAAEYPEASFIGCDLSRRALASAQRLVDSLGLANLELRRADVCDVDEGWGPFDYIICHDVFSWVAPPIRQQILTIQRRNLAPYGVGYVSYDVLPGWHLHEIARDMMRYHAGRLSDPQEAVDQARAMLAMGAAVQDQEPGAFAELLREEYFRFGAIPDDQLYHLAFSEHHRAFYFHEFIQTIGDAALQFLADSEATRSAGPRQPGAARAFLDRLPRLEQQQYSDFLTDCTRRGALVCHRDLALRSRPEEEVLRDCWISLAPVAPGEFVAPDLPTQEALSRLQERRPEFVAFSELGETGPSATAFFMDAYAAGLLDLALSPRRLSSRISDRPTVNPLVRLQARDASTVTNQKCEPVRLTDLVRHLVTLLDGVHTRQEVTDSVAQEIRSGTLANEWVVRLEGNQLDVGRLVGDKLRYLRDHALLVA